MTYPIQAGPFFRAAPNWRKAAKHSLPQNFSTRTDEFTVCSLECCSITTPWGKPSNLWTPWGYSLRPRVPSWIWIRLNSIRLTQEQLYVTSKIVYVDCDAKFCSDIQQLHPKATFSGNIHASPPKTQEHTLMGDYIIPVLNQQTRLLLHLWRPYLTQTLNNALTVTLHISLRHLAAKMPSQLHNSFLSSFLPSYETCWINVTLYSTLPLKLS